MHLYPEFWSTNKNQETEKTRPLVSWIASLALTSTEFELVIRLVFSGIGQQYTEPLKPRVIHLQPWQNGLASRRKFF